MPETDRDAICVLPWGRLAYISLLAFMTFVLAVAMRLLEWPSWQNPEYMLGREMLLATHDSYHWVAGAAGFGTAAGHPMALLLKYLSEATGYLPANIAFWLPCVMAGFVAVMVCLWCALLGSAVCGVAAGLMTSMAPGFLGRTLLGYYDTDIVTLLFPLCMTFVPAMFLNGLFKMRSLEPGQRTVPEEPVYLIWIAVLAFSGILSWLCASWHSLFPYLIRCNAFLILVGALFCGSSKKACLLAGAAHVLPALGGWPYFAIVLLFLVPSTRFRKSLLLYPVILAALWLFIAFLALKGNMLAVILNHAGAYLKSGGVTHTAGGASVIFPSVAQSIIEVQDLSLMTLLPYFHPWLEGAAAGVVGFVWVLGRRPVALFLLPLLALGFSSARLGGRMVMFGAPVTAIGLSLGICWFLKFLLRKFALGRFSSSFACIILLGFFVLPYLYIIPALSQGPILNRRHAAALSQLRKITPEDSMIWLWWDWGYAAQYFGRRETICDGAKHGGPSLYLPAAVFATDNPRFARQIIRRTSKAGNEPGNFFSGMDDLRAQALVNTLRSAQTPLVAGNGSQFIVVSFEMLKLGFWISNYGNWNFVTHRGEGGALSIVPQALSYNLRLGEVRLAGSGRLIFPNSINVFEETGVTRRNYLQEWLDKNPDATRLQRLAWAAGRRNINFLFNRVTDEKLAMGEDIYNSLMVQLLLCDPGDGRFGPYFKLVYDNVFTRIYEVLGEEENGRKAERKKAADNEK